MASQFSGSMLDSPSPLSKPHNAAEKAGTLTVRSTAGVPPKERLEFWRRSVLHRMDPVAPKDESHFSGRMVHIAGNGCDFVDHASEAIHTRRDAQRLRKDDGDEIILSLVGRRGSTHLSHAGQHKLRGDDLCVADFTRPIEHVRSRHRDITLIFTRERLAAAFKGDLSKLAGRLLPRHGIAALLRSHLRLIATEAERLSSAERAVALAAAAEMALLALQAACQVSADVAGFPDGIHAAALALIRQNCWNPELGPDAVAAGLGCSRAKLYRVFSARDASVAKTIWNERLDQARRMLTAPEHSSAYIADVAFRSGFIDMPTFNRMFKKRFGMTPSESRRGMT